MVYLIIFIAWVVNNIVIYEVVRMATKSKEKLWYEKQKMQLLQDILNETRAARRDK